jgi:hypothetical protein
VDFLFFARGGKDDRLRRKWYIVAGTRMKVIQKGGRKCVLMLEVSR